ncbi:MAG: DUF86 domain-containing protein [Actinomycetota bacterium]|nr:DUF86 domain-containing protein [Actinomycetota bacterium]
MRPTLTRGRRQANGSTSSRSCVASSRSPSDRAVARVRSSAEDPHVAWSAAARMRDRLVHHYFDIDLDILWATVTRDLPTLLEALDRSG